MVELAVQDTLEDWIVSYWHSAEYKALTESMRLRDHITPPGETAMLCALISRLRPERALEIGTFFGRTTLAMAEAISANGTGRLDTIDPFGGDRIPAIMDKWPEAMRKVTDFKPIYSMEYFSTLEASGGWLGLAFVDGNHTFDYALYDMLCAAGRLLPGGVIVLDNLELEGPYLAGKMFLSLNRGWKVFCQGTLLDADAAQTELKYELLEGGAWAVLLSPRMLQVSGKGFQNYGKTPPKPKICGVRLNIADASREMPVLLNFVHVARAYDSHITGEKAVAQRTKLSQDVRSGRQVMEYRFDPPLDLGVAREDMNFNYLLEISLPRIEDYLLLDPAQPFELLYGADAPPA